MGVSIMKKYVNGEYIEMTEEEIKEFTTPIIQEEQQDKLDTLIQGLSSAKSITEIRELAKDILKETE